MTFATVGLPALGLRFSVSRNFAASDIPDLTGKTAVVTGGTEGIGLEAVVELAGHGAEVVILGSSETRGQQAIGTIFRRTGKKVDYVPLNLASIKAARHAGKKIAKKCTKIDILLLNAGVGGSAPMTEEGYDGVFACNHLDHFAFVEELKHLFTGPDVRVVVVSSASHYTAKAIDYQEIKRPPLKESKKFGDVFAQLNSRYEVSKLANVLYARGLQKKVGDNVFVNVLHPGVIRTTLQDQLQDAFRSFGIFATTFWFLFN